MSRWLAGVFDPGARADTRRLDGALRPDAAASLESGPLRLAFSGPAVGSTDPVCLFDGHLDNAAEIRGQLGLDAPPAHSPEALLAAAYRRWGQGLPSRMRGDFALVVWDREQGEGLLARDQLGARPLFLYDSGEAVLFANEIRHLLALLPRRPAPDPASVAHWIALSNRPGTQTLYEGVRRLMPGGILLLQRRGVREMRYWTPRFEEPLDLPPAQLAEPLRDGLERAVGRRLTPSGTTGVTMSGGLDSSSVAALSAAQAPGRVLAC